MATQPIFPQAPEASTVENDGTLLAHAFSSFTRAAASLERSYSQLQRELSRLRRELEESNRDLARSLEENLRMREHLDRILDNLPCGVLVVEADTRVSVANPEARRLLGAGPATTLAPAIAELLCRVRKPGGEFEYGFPNGTRWIAVRRAWLSAQQGGSAIFILEDVSGLKRLEREHEGMRRRQALAGMAATLAHEIRNPLGSLELFAGLLAESALGPLEKQWVEHLQAGLRTLAATANNVLHFHSQPPSALVPSDLGPLLRSLTQFLQPSAQRAGVQIELNQTLDGVLVAADRHRLQQVFLNLALNAFRCMPRGGQFRISGKAGPANASVEVSDTGPGITESDLDRIFTPGFTTRPGSPGLGLAVCKTIMEQHGGWIRASSLPGQGASFQLGIPILAESRS